mgnify:FL=1
MPARRDLCAWDNDVELVELRRVTEQLGMSKERAANYLNEKFHKGQPIRSEGAVSMMRTRKGWKVAPQKKGGEQEVEREEVGDRIILKSNGPRIKTVAELVAHGGIDTTKWEIDRQKLKAYDSTMRGEDGSPVTIQNFSLHVEVVRKQGASITDAVQAIIAGAFAERKLLPKAKLAKVGTSGLMQALVIADPHVAKHAWNAETGHGDYDIKLATTALRDASAYLMERGNRERLEARHIYVLGDYFHYDTPSGTTTKGTPLERDGRVPKMIEEGAKALFDIIAASTDECPTHVVVIGGNHDEILCHSLQMILQSHFRYDTRVTIDGTHTVRKYQSWGKCLIGLTHGDKAKKFLPSLMAREASDRWSQSTLREWHRGHLHYRKDVDTLEGVLIRQHPALCPPDAWHAGEGFISPRGMDAIIYHKAGAVVATHSYTPDVIL